MTTHFSKLFTAATRAHDHPEDPFMQPLLIVSSLSALEKDRLRYLVVKYPGFSLKLLRLVDCRFYETVRENQHIRARSKVSNVEVVDEATAIVTYNFQIALATDKLVVDGSLDLECRFV